MHICVCGMYLFVWKLNIVTKKEYFNIYRSNTGQWGTDSKRWNWETNVIFEWWFGLYITMRKWRKWSLSVIQMKREVGYKRWSLKCIGGFLLCLIEWTLVPYLYRATATDRWICGIIYATWTFFFLFRSRPLEYFIIVYNNSVSLQIYKDSRDIKGIN